jgi:polysaccharide export outer membrane protein
MNIARVAASTFVLFLLAMGAAQAALHPGDRVQISVYNHPELATQATVDAEGRISMQLVGAVPAQGASETELAARIQERLQKYMRFPAVDVVLVQQSNDMFVVGGPGGTVAYRPGDTLLTALNDIETQCKCQLSQSAGDTSNIRVIRDGMSMGPYDMDALEKNTNGGPSLQPGDTITFANRPIAVSVTGALTNPGTSYLSADQPLSAAIQQRGGTTAEASHQVLLRRDGRLIQIAEGSPEFNAPAHPGDTLEIPSQEHIQVIGAVNAAGEVALKDDFTLVSAIYLAGGPNKWANLRKIMVQHRGQTKTYDITRMQHGDLSQNPALEDGDVVFVPEGHKIDWRGFFQDLTWGRWLLPNGRIP